MALATNEQIMAEDCRCENENRHIIIIINEFHRDASLKKNFRAAVCHVLH